MTVNLDVICDGCQQSIDAEGEVYCARCWLSAIATLPQVERELRELAKGLTGKAAQACEALADRIYDMNNQ